MAYIRSNTTNPIMTSHKYITYEGKYTIQLIAFIINMLICETLVYMIKSMFAICQTLNFSL